MIKSTYYELNLVEGSDLVNPLVQDVPNYEKIDEQMHKNESASVGKATELVSATVHALTRENEDTSVFRFTATSNFNAGETFTVDGLQVTALTPAGETLPSGAYIIGSEVLCALRDTLLTVYVSGSEEADNSKKLEGHPASYFGTAQAVQLAQSTADAVNTIAQANQQNLDKIMNMSEDEVVVGTDIDGSVIYRKTVALNLRKSDFTLSTNRNNAIISTGLSVNKLIKLDGSFMLAEGDRTTWRCLPFTWFRTATNLGINAFVDMDTSSREVRVFMQVDDQVYNGLNSDRNTAIYLTIEYTK